MGYNISDVGGQTTGGPDQWTATLDLNDGSASTVSGDFDVVSLSTGASLGEATGGYSFSALSNPSFGTLDFNTTTGTYTFTPDWSAILATGSDQVVSFTVTGRSAGQVDDDTVTINLLICVARGTRIDTVNGPVAVEDLRRGDLVVTLDGAPQPVRWIGSRRLGPADLAADPDKRPIRIRANALGPGRPARDLSVSPQHRMYLRDWRAALMFGAEEVLVPAKSLVNDRDILRDTAAEAVEYFHILFDRHEIIFAEGAPTESFHPGHYTLAELDAPVRAELEALFPDLARDGAYGVTARQALRPWEARLLAPLTEAVAEPDAERGAERGAEPVALSGWGG